MSGNTVKIAGKERSCIVATITHTQVMKWRNAITTTGDEVAQYN